MSPALIHGHIAPTKTKMLDAAAVHLALCQGVTSLKNMDPDLLEYLSLQVAESNPDFTQAPSPDLEDLVLPFLMSSEIVETEEVSKASKASISHHSEVDFLM